jgi:hypothetical protein
MASEEEGSMRAKWYSVCGIHQTRERIEGPCPACASSIAGERALPALALTDDDGAVVRCTQSTARREASRRAAKQLRERGSPIDAVNRSSLAQRRSWERADEELRRG